MVTDLNRGDLPKLLAMIRRDVNIALEIRGSCAESWEDLADTIRPYSFAAVAADLAGVQKDIQNADWCVRAGAVITLGRIAETSRSVADELSRTAFDDGDARVRGIAWCTVNEAHRDPHRKQFMQEALRQSLEARFGERAKTGGRPSDVEPFVAAVAGTVALAVSTHWLRESKARYLEGYAGDDRATIETGWQVAENFLEHPNPKRRIAALFIIWRDRPSSVPAAERVRRMMLADPDTDVRGRAIRTYAALYAKTNDRGAQRALATLALDESRPALQRFSAFDGLLSVRGVQIDCLPIRRARREAPERWAMFQNGGLGDEWPIEVDWSLITECSR